MARRKDEIIWHLMDAPWCLSVLLAGVIYLGLSYLLPSLAASSDNFIFNAMAPNFPLMAPSLFYLSIFTPCADSIHALGIYYNPA